MVARPQNGGSTFNNGSIYGQAGTAGQCHNRTHALQKTTRTGHLLDHLVCAGEQRQSPQSSRSGQVAGSVLRVAKWAPWIRGR